MWNWEEIDERIDAYGKGVHELIDRIYARLGNPIIIDNVSKKVPEEV